MCTTVTTTHNNSIIIITAVLRQLLLGSLYDNVRWGTRVSTYVPRSVHGALNIRQASDALPQDIIGAQTNKCDNILTGNGNSKLSNMNPHLGGLLL